MPALDELANTAGVLIACTILACAFEHDRRRRRVANILNAGLVGAFVLHAASGAAPGPLDGHLMVGIATLGALAVLALMRKVGPGDAKLAGACALWAGPSGATLLCAGTALGLLALVIWATTERMHRRGRRTRSIPVACALVPATVAVIVARTAGAPV